MNLSTLNPHHFCVYQVLVYITTILKLVICRSCSSAQVGSNHTFREVFRHTIDAPVKIAWLKDGKDVSHCIPRLPCSDRNEVNTTTTLKDLGNRNYEIQLVVHQITTSDAGLWSLEYFGPANKEYPAPIFECQLKLEAYSTTKQVNEMIKKSTIIKTLFTSSIDTTTTTKVFVTSAVKTPINDQNTNNGNGEQLTLIVILSVVSFLLVFIITLFFFIFRCRIKIYSRFTRRRERSSQFNAHVYESIEDIHTSSQEANYRYANHAVTYSNVTVTEQSNAAYITVI